MPEALWQAELQGDRLINLQAQHCNHNHGMGTQTTTMAWVPCIGCFEPDLARMKGAKRGSNEKFGKFTLWPENTNKVLAQDDIGEILCGHLTHPTHCRLKDIKVELIPKTGAPCSLKDALGALFPRLATPCSASQALRGCCNHSASGSPHLRLEADAAVVHTMLLLQPNTVQ